jgi:hypothetical protein
MQDIQCKTPSVVAPSDIPKFAKTGYELITPLQAKEMVDRHEARRASGELHQRSLANRSVSSYAGDMKMGAFIPTHQGIGIDVNEDIVDGQHRLWGIVQSGQEQWILVTRNLPLFVVVAGQQIPYIDFVDRGATRTIIQQLQVDKVSHASLKVACARTIGQVCCRPHSIKVSTMQTRAILDLGFGRNIDSLLELGLSKRLLKAPVMTPISVLAQSNFSAAHEFAIGLSTKANIPPGSPILALDRFMTYGIDRGTPGCQTPTMVATCHALWAYINGQCPKSVSGTKGFYVGWIVETIGEIADKVKFNIIGLKR